MMSRESFVITQLILIVIVTAVASNAQSNETFDVDLTRFPGDACFRDCDKAVPRVCYFRWHLEHYHVLGPACGSCGLVNGNVTDCFNDQCITADGVERGVMSINRQIPGPSIHVCISDLIVVDVTNAMGGTSAAIHWHGFHQRKTPFMDGVPFITQCPIQFSTTFRYAFEATEAGTQFYHSHSGHHKVNGHYGGIVVRKNAKDDPNSDAYDEDLKEHLIVASDWMEQDAEMFMPGLRSHQIGIQPTNLLINGKGTIHNKTSGRSATGTPLAVFRVQRGRRYRFRFINSLSHVCPAQLEIENHSLLIIASDSYDLQPVTVDSLVSTSGERYDFVVNANQIGDMHWIRLRAIGPCEGRQLEQFAVLSYAPRSVDSIRLAYPVRKFPDFTQKFGKGRFLNHPNATCGTNDMDNLCITDLSSYVEKPEITSSNYDYRFILGFNNHLMQMHEVFGKDNYGHFMHLHDETVLVGAINNISFVFPPFSPLTQPEHLNDNLFCDEANIPERCEGKRICPCVHRLKVKLNSIVELVVVDETAQINPLNHPFHLHGYQLFVMAMGQRPDKKPMTVELARQMTMARQFRTASTTKHAIKDTISIPSKGYTIFRFKADNPGWWLLHCHYEWHMAVGMGLVLQVGEPHEMPASPKDFPKCNDFVPNVDASFFNATTTRS